MSDNQTTKLSDQERLTIAYRDQRDRAIGELARARGEIDRLRAEISAYRDAALYDPMMSGEARFKGWNRSALDRARRMTEARIAECNQ